jgi:hypothetical protein
MLPVKPATEIIDLYQQIPCFVEEDSNIGTNYLCVCIKLL